MLNYDFLVSTKHGSFFVKIDDTITDGLAVHAEMGCNGLEHKGTFAVSHVLKGDHPSLMDRVWRINSDCLDMIVEINY